jgi:hypothetical protein
MEKGQVISSRIVRMIGGGLFGYGLGGYLIPAAHSPIDPVLMVLGIGVFLIGVKNS